MRFKNDNQRRAMFAAINGGNGGRVPSVVGKFKEVYSNSKFSDQKNIKVDGRNYNPKGNIDVVMSDPEWDEILTDDLEDTASRNQAEASLDEEPELLKDVKSVSTDKERVPIEEFKYEEKFGVDVEQETPVTYAQRFEGEVIGGAKDASVDTMTMLKKTQAAQDIAYQERRPVLERAWRAGVKGVEGDIISATERVAHMPQSFGSGVVETGRTFKRGIEGAAGPALARGAGAFGTVAGGAVAGGLREVGDIITLPQKEYHMPPGTQKVYDYGSDRYVTKRVDTRPLQPLVPQMGIGQFAGVRVAPEEFIAGQESMQHGLWGMTGQAAERAFKERSKSSGFRVPSSMPMGGVSRMASSVLRQRSDLDRMRGLYGSCSPNVQRQEAALQSRVGYLDRKTVPGSNQDLIMRSSGLRMV